MDEISGKKDMDLLMKRKYHSGMEVGKHFVHLLHIINLNDSLLRGRKAIRLFRVLVEHLLLGIIIRNSSIISENFGKLDNPVNTSTI